MGIFDLFNLKKMKANRLIWFAILFVIFLMLLMITKPYWGQQSSVFVNDQLKSMSQQELQKEKLHQDILKLRLENKKISSFLEPFSSYGTLITALVAIAGVIITIWKQIAQQEAGRRQRENESLRRLDEKFTSIVANLCSKNEAIQASAAVSIISFLRPEYEAFHNQVFMVLLANLKLQHSKSLNKLLIKGFEKAIRIQLQSIKKKDKQFELDLSSSNLYRVDLSGLDLSQADIAFSKLRGANLTKTNLYRIKGWEANLDKAMISKANMEESRLRKAQIKNAQLHETRLVSADLKETNLANTQFYRAEMQSAHLEKSNLNGAKFEQANINDAYFHGANLNDITMKSIIKAFNWDKAHFDDNISAKLEELARSNSKNC